MKMAKNTQGSSLIICSMVEASIYGRMVVSMKGLLTAGKSTAAANIPILKEKLDLGSGRGTKE